MSDRRDSAGSASEDIATAGNTVKSPPQPVGQQTSPTNLADRSPFRPSSPAKRTAADMEGGSEQPPTRQTNSATISSPPRTVAEPMQGREDSTSTKSRNGVHRHQRSVSVDMLGNERATDGTVDYSAASSESNMASNNDTSTPSTSATSCASSSPPDTAKLGPPGAPSDFDHYARQLDLDQQYNRVLQIQSQPLEEGQLGYAVANQWLQRVLARTSEGQKNPGTYAKDAVEGEIGPVDNSSIEGPIDITVHDKHSDIFIPLKPSARMYEDFEVVPEEAWKLIKEWYGLAPRSHEIKRYAHNTAPQGSILENVQYELFPPIFTLRKLRSRNAGITMPVLKELNTLAPRLVASRNSPFQPFLRRAKKALSINMNTECRVWRVLVPDQPIANEEPTGMLTPASSRSGSPALPPSAQPREKITIDMNAFTAMAEGVQREMVDVRDETMNRDFKDSNSKQLEAVGLFADQTLILEERAPDGAGSDFASDAARKDADKNGISISITKDGSTRMLDKSQFRMGGDSGRNSPAPSGPMTRGRTRRDGRTRGTVGLTNLGNTCYMNSALQCIRSVEELTLYFLQENYKEDINEHNVLGFGGNIARAYAGLLASIYGEGSMSSFTPNNIKKVVGRYAPQFTGYGQQDSQEFLQFLIDGLHEDLNRIVKPPYIENPDSDDNHVHDSEYVRELGEKYREIHRARNNSVATDLFYGFYKNTMVCPECKKVSITFDPYSSLTLQLPIERSWMHMVNFVPLEGKPYLVDVDMDKNGTIRSLKEYVAHRVPGLDADRLMAVEIFSHKFYRTFEDKLTISESNIADRDEVVLYELEDVPTNFPPKKKHAKVRSMLMIKDDSSDDELQDPQSPLAERMLVSIFHRIPKSRGYSSNKDLVLWPSFIILNREEAKDYDTILRKVLSRVQSMTTKNILDVDGTGLGAFTSRKSSDAILTTEEDASSNTDSRIHATSVESEDGIVDVSMAESGEPSADQSPAAGSSESEPARPAQRAAVLESGSFIPGELRGLFQMKYMPASVEMVPTGWSAFDSGKEYPTLESRIQQLRSRRSSIQSQASQGPSSSGSEEVDDIPEMSAQQPPPFDPNPDSDEDLPDLSQLTQRRSPQNHRGHVRGKNKRMQTYTRKGKRVPTQARQTRIADVDGANDSDDNPALIRLGEAIVLDWNPDAYDSLFGGQDGDTMRGVETFDKDRMEIMADKDLPAKRARRAERKKMGISLEECFTETAKTEILSEDNSWYCPRCKEHRRASKTLEIWTAPDILVVHLKRFSGNRGFNQNKINVLVDFPTEGLDISTRVGLPEDKSLVYDLFAVDNHYGGLGGGHYTAFAQNFFDNKWYEYNDSQVSQISTAKSVVTSAAYLLFYRRRADHPLGPPYLQKIVHDAYNPAPESESHSRSSSRPDSPKGQRLGDPSSLSGSSSASAAAGAGPQHVAGSEVPGGTRVRRGSDDEAERPPAYFDDEGVAMDEDELGFNQATRLNAVGPVSLYQQNAWSFGEFGGAADTQMHEHEHDQIGGDALADVFADADGASDVASDAPMAGSDADDDLQNRMIQDFGDEIFDSGVRPGQVSPAMGLSTPGSELDVPPLLEDEGPVQVDLREAMGGEEMEAPVAEVRLPEGEEGA